MNPDTWLYTSVGRDLLGGHKLPRDLSLWAAKPFAIVLGALTRPFPVDHAFQAEIEIALAVLLTALFVAGARTGRYLGGLAAVATFAVMPGFREGLYGGEIDVVVAAFVVLAVATSGRARLAFLVLAGLLRPEAWLVAGLAAFLQATGSSWRRLLAAVVMGVFPLATWLSFVAVTRGDLGGSVSQAEGGFRGTLWSAPYTVAKAVGVEGGLVLCSLGLIGLAWRYWERSFRQTDLLPLALVTIWPAQLAFGYFRGLPPSDRYVLPVVAVLALGVGDLVSRAAARARALDYRPAMLGALAAVWVAVVVLTADPSTHDRVYADDHSRIHKSLPAIDSALKCGRLLVAGPTRVRQGGPVPRSLTNFVPEIAAVSDRPLERFGLASDDVRPYAAVLRVYGAVAQHPGWRRSSLPIGQLAVSPSCRDSSSSSNGKLVIAFPAARLTSASQAPTQTTG